MDEMYWAAANGHLDMVKYLVSKGADVRARFDFALQCTAFNGHLDIVKYLVENGADVRACDDFALRWAAANRHWDIVKYLRSVLNENS